ncbi:hypothetical protein ACVWXU_005646 [Streptomyces sp. TE33382]
MVPGRHMRHSGTDGLHHPGALVAEDHRRGKGDRAVDHGQIAVAQTRRGHRDQHLAGSRVAYLQVVDDLGPRAVENDASHLGSLGRPSTRSAMMFRWISSEPP